MASPAQAGDTGRESDGAVSSGSAPAVASLYAKIAEVMAEVGRVAKRGRNDFHKYDYVTEADLVEAVRSKLAERNVALIPGVVGIDERPYKTDRGKESVVTTVRMQFVFIDGDSGDMFRTEWAGQGDDPADKGLYKAYTGALKYFLMKTFLIPTGDDPEGDRNTDERGRQAAVEPGQPPLTDDRAKQLTVAAREAFKELAALDANAVPKTRFDAWLAGVAHSHEDLERLGVYLRERKGEIEAEREVTG